MLFADDEALGSFVDIGYSQVKRHSSLKSIGFTPCIVNHNQHFSPIGRKKSNWGNEVTAFRIEEQTV